MSSSNPNPSASRPPIAPKNKPSHSSRSSSSIGENSSEDDRHNTPTSADTDQAQPAATALSLNALEDALPIRKGISSHHGGKMKSYVNLDDAATDSSIVKPTDPYSKKRKNRVATEIYIGGMGKGPTSKKPTTDSLSTALPLINVGSETSSQDDKSTPDSDSSSSEEKDATTPDQ